MKTKVPVFALLLCLCLSQVQAQLPVQYNFDQPTEVLELDSTLREISGLSAVPGDTSLLSCVHDERGVVYFILKSTGAIKCSIDFRPTGDFEGIELVQKTAYAIKSDGDIYVVDLKDCNKPKTRQTKTNLGKEHDIESLSYDHAQQQLVFIAKENPKLTSPRGVYAVPIALLSSQAEVEPKLLFQIDPVALRARANADAKNYFSPSGLAIDEARQVWWVLSSASKEIAAFHPTGQLMELVSLKKELFQQPEGICIDHLGNLYITNESKHGKPANLIMLQRKL